MKQIHFHNSELIECFCTLSMILIYWYIQPHLVVFARTFVGISTDLMLHPYVVHLNITCEAIGRYVFKMSVQAILNEKFYMRNQLNFKNKLWFNQRINSKSSETIFWKVSLSLVWIISIFVIFVIEFGAFIIGYIFIEFITKLTQRINRKHSPISIIMKPIAHSSNNITFFDTKHV